MKSYLLALALLLGVSVANATDSYGTVTEAAVAGLAAAEALTADFEAGGAIYQCGERFAFLPPVTDGRKTSLNIPILSGLDCKLAGLFHTHPKGDGRFSATDVKSACKLSVLSYIKPKGGLVRVFDCRDLSYAAIKLATDGSRPITGKEI